MRSEKTAPSEKLQELRARVDRRHGRIRLNDDAPDTETAAHTAEKEIAEAPASATSNLPAVAGAADGFEIVASGADQRRGGIVGMRLKFVKGEYVIGQLQGELLIGHRLIALDAAEAWTKFDDDGQLEEVIQHKPGEIFPAREALGDNDPKDWPLGPDGIRPSDPWQLSQYLYLVDPKTHAEYTFVTSSFGGRRAVQQLCQQIVARRDDYDAPGDCALIELGKTKFPSKKFGSIQPPDLKIVGWVDRRGRPLPEKTLSEELDDEIPE